MAVSAPVGAGDTSLSRLASKRVGDFERLPKWINLVPMVAQWLWLGLRHGSVTLPSSANPHITAGGLVGDTKSEYFHCMGALARSKVADFVVVHAHGAASLAAALAAMREANLGFPIVAKPDLGWCGFGVRRIDDAAALRDYLARYPHDAALMLQQYLSEPGEAGLFYTRHPDQPAGRLLGILLRHYPQVVGDGTSTVAQLIKADVRLRRATHSPAHECSYTPEQVPAAGEIVRLSLIASTRVGGRYEDGSSHATVELTEAVEAVARDMPQFHIGRLDVRYLSLEHLRRGQFTIMEVNGAGSEAVYAWDSKYSIREVYRMVFTKQRLLFALAAANRARGHKPVGVFALARHYLRQQRLIRQYPPSN
ncbi:MAG: hypothetical protein ABIU96_00705 [Rhodanobacter sp.]